MSDDDWAPENPLDEMMEQRVVDVRDLEMFELHEQPPAELPPAIAFLRDGLTLVILPLTTPGMITLEISGWMLGDPVPGSDRVITLAYDGWQRLVDR
jgi:hypothetical protein